MAFPPVGLHPYKEAMAQHNKIRPLTLPFMNFLREQARLEWLYAIPSKLETVCESFEVSDR